MGWAERGTDDKQANTENENQKTTPTTSPIRTNLKIEDKKQRLLCVGGAAPESREPHTKKQGHPT